MFTMFFFLFLFSGFFAYIEFTGKEISDLVLGGSTAFLVLFATWCCEYLAVNL